MIEGPGGTAAELVRKVAESGTSRSTALPGGGRMAWRVFGAGPPVLLLHGGYGSWTHWLRTIPDLARDHRLLVPDLPGYGDSDLPPGLDGAEAMATLVARGAQEVLGADGPVALAGFSFGGIVAGHIARRRPRFARRLVLIGAGGLGLRRAAMPDLVNWRGLADPGERAAAHARNLAILMIHDPGRIDPLAVHLQAENARRARFRSRTIALTSTLRDCLAETRAPLAGIWGRENATARGYLDERRELLRGFDPAAEFEVIEGAGHWVQYEAPEAFNAALRAILSRARSR